MKSANVPNGSYALVYDAGRMDIPPAGYFNIEYWRSKNAVQGEAVGRGSAWFLRSPGGGWAAKLSRRGYVFTGVTRSRPFREYRVLSDLAEKGLPVPKPVAAICEFQGLTYNAAIMTVTIPSARPLADMLIREPQIAADAGTWHGIGRCTRRFHEAGLWHADLNARNILIDDQRQVFLVDFDRAKYSPGKPVNGQGNLKRLKRSLLKVWPTSPQPGLDAAWELLTVAYHAR